MAADGQGELVDINIGRDDRPVPAHIKLIVGGEYTLVKDLKRGFQKRWTSPLQDHLTFLRKAGSNLPRSGAAGQWKINHALRPCRPRESRTCRCRFCCGKQSPSRHHAMKHAIVRHFKPPALVAQLKTSGAGEMSL